MDELRTVDIKIIIPELGTVNINDGGVPFYIEKIKIIHQLKNTFTSCLSSGFYGCEETL